MKGGTHGGENSMKATEGVKESRKPERGCCRRDSAEHEEEGRVLSAQRMAEKNDTIAEAQGRTTKLLEEIRSLENLNDAYR